MKVKVISLPYIFQVLYVLCFTRPRYQVSVYRTIGPLVIKYHQIPTLFLLLSPPAYLIFTYFFKKCIVGNKNKVLLIYILVFSISISHFNAMHEEFCVEDFPRATVPRILKFETNNYV